MSSNANTLSIKNITINENDTIAQFRIQLKNATTTNLEFYYRTSDGTATSPNEYVHQEGKLIFQAGETEKVITINIVDDTKTEATETFTLTIEETKKNDNFLDGLSDILSGDQIPLMSAIGEATILDNDALVTNRAPIISGLPTSPQTITVGAATSLIDFTATDADNNNLTVTLTPSNGTIGGLTDADPSLAGIQLTGSVTNINTALAGATFTATTVGPASISVSVTDGLMANPITGSYGFAAEASKPIIDSTTGLTIFGTPETDILIGGPGNDLFIASPGFDFINGDQGIDTVMYGGNRSAYNIESMPGYIGVSGGFGVQNLFNIERLKFSDVQVAYDTQLGGAVGNATLMVTALVGKHAVSDKALMGVVINFFEAHGSLLAGVKELINMGFIDALVGSQPSQFVSAIYSKVTTSNSLIEMNSQIGTLHAVAANKTLADAIVSIVENSIIQEGVNLIGYANTTGIEYII